MGLSGFTQAMLLYPEGCPGPSTVRLDSQKGTAQPVEFGALCPLPHSELPSPCSLSDPPPVVVPAALRFSPVSGTGVRESAGSPAFIVERLSMAGLSSLAACSLPLPAWSWKPLSKTITRIRPGGEPAGWWKLDRGGEAEGVGGAQIQTGQPRRAGLGAFAPCGATPGGYPWAGPSL